MSRIHPIGAVLATAGLVAATLVVSGITANADVAGDNYAGAIAESGSNWTTTVSTVGATIETGEVVSTGDPALTRQTSVWLRWTATASGLATVSANSSDVATVGLAVFTGASVAEAKQLGFSATGSIENQAVQAGTTYLVQVTGIGAPGASTGGAVTVGLAGPGAKGAARPSVAPSGHVFGSVGKDGKAPAPRVITSTPQTAPLNDNFSAALLVTGAEAFLTEDNTGATIQAHEPVQLSPVSHYTMHSSIWFKWKAPASGRIVLDTDGSGVTDTVLAIFSGSTMATAKRLAWNDQGGVSGNYARIVSFAVTKGVTYHFQVGGAGNLTGSISLTLAGDYVAPANDAVGQAIKLGGVSGTVSGTDLGATVEPSFEQVDNPDSPTFPILDSVWWKWTAPADGLLDANTNGSVPDTTIAIFEQSNYGTFTRTAFNDDGSGSDGYLSGVTVYAGYTYFFQVGHVAQPRGAVQLNYGFTAVGPQISSISPNAGHLAGGNTVTIKGSGLGNVTDVLLGYQGYNIPATHVVVLSPTKLTFKVPAGLHRVTYYVWVEDLSHTSRLLGAPGYRYF
jgi:hypothetical protein